MTLGEFRDQCPRFRVPDRDGISRNRGQHPAVGRDGQGVPQSFGFEEEMGLARLQVPGVDTFFGQSEEGASGRIEARVLDRGWVPVTRAPQAADEHMKASGFGSSCATGQWPVILDQGEDDQGGDDAHDETHGGWLSFVVLQMS